MFFFGSMRDKNKRSNAPLVITNVDAFRHAADIDSKRNQYALAFQPERLGFALFCQACEMNRVRRFDQSPLDQRERSPLEHRMMLGHSIMRQHAKRPQDIRHVRLPRDQSRGDRGKREQRVRMNDVECLDVFS